MEKSYKVTVELRNANEDMASSVENPHICLELAHDESTANLKACLRLLPEFPVEKGWTFSIIETREISHQELGDFLFDGKPL
jgi:hypothetical protein